MMRIDAKPQSLASADRGLHSGSALFLARSIQQSKHHSVILTCISLTEVGTVGICYRQNATALEESQENVVVVAIAKRRRIIPRFRARGD
jgi:hypothetical protein